MLHLLRAPGPLLKSEKDSSDSLSKLQETIIQAIGALGPVLLKKFIGMY